MSRKGLVEKRMHAATVLAAAGMAALAASVVADPNTTVNYTLVNSGSTTPTLWTSAATWSPSGPVGGPDGAGLYIAVNFSISQSRTVNVDGGTKTIGRLDIGDGSGYSASDRFAIGATGGGVLNFDGNGGNAIINTTTATSGDQINVPITLATDLDITNNATVAGSTLRMAAVSATGNRTLTLKKGLLALNSTVGSTVTLRLGDGSGTLSAGMSFVSQTYNGNIIARSGTTNNTLTLSTSAAPVFGGLVTVDHDLTLRPTGSGSITLSGSTALTGSSNVLVSGGAITNTVTLGGSNAGFLGAVSVSSATFRVSTAGALSSANVVSVDSGANFHLSTGATAAVNQTIAGLGNGGTGAGTVSNLSSQVATLTLGGAGEYSFGGTITGTTLANMGLAKSGSGTQTLTGVSDYTGATNISAGKLIVGDGVSGSLGNTAVSVAGGTLGGRGSIAGGVDVGAAGTLNAGLASTGSIGTLATGTLTLSGTLAVDIDRGAVAADQIAVTGTVDVSGATLGLLLAVSESDTLSTFVLINNDGGLIVDGGDAIIGSFAGLTRGGALDSAVVTSGAIQGVLYYGYDAATSSLTGGNDLALQITSVPEPGALSLISAASLVLLNRRRRRCAL